MSYTLFKKLWRDHYKGMLGYGLGLFAYSYLMAVMSPTINKISGLENYFQTLPESFKLAFGVTTIKFSFDQFMGMKYLNLMWGLIVLFFIAFFVASMIAGEVEQGTIELLLARPISRPKIVLTKTLVFLLGLLLLVGLTLLGFFLPSLYLSLDIVWSAILKTMLMLFLFSLAIFGYSFLFASSQSERGKVIAFSTSLWVVFYFMDFASKFWSGVDWLGRYSLFHYYRYSELLIGQSIRVGDVALYLVVFFVCLAGGIFIFHKRDIAVK